MRAIRLKTEYLKDPLGIDRIRPRLYWNVAEGISQSAYEISANVDGKDYRTGKVAGAQMTHIAFPFADHLQARSYVQWKVRLWDAQDLCDAWSEDAVFEMGLLDQEDWQAAWMTGDYTPDEKHRYPADYFRKEFEIEAGAITSSRLYITACGVYQCYINGKRVGQDLLTPGSTNYQKRLQYQTYDVAAYLQDGKNVMQIVLTDGWYRGFYGGNNSVCEYGCETKVLCQLEMVSKDGGIEKILSDDTWRWSNDGAIRFADNKGGEVVEADRQPSYQGRAKKTTYTVLPTASNNVPIRAHEVFSPEIIQTSSGQTVLDFGQNIAGGIAFDLMAKSGQKLTLKFGEYIENGAFTQANIDTTAKKKPEEKKPFQEIHYTCKEGRNRYRNENSIFGFRYVLVETDVAIKAEDFQAIAEYSDMEFVTEFSSSSELLNDFVTCTTWSAKNNHADSPTDCPTRERLGWTGDAQIFYNTGCDLMDYAAFSRKFIYDMMDAQRENGTFPQITPRNKITLFVKAMDSSSGWADAGVLIPYRMWKRYGDTEILQEAYPAMRAYGDFLIRRCGKRSLFGKVPKIPKADRKYLVNYGFSYGEWIEPKELVPFNMKDLSRPQAEVATAYTAYMMRLLTEIAETVGARKDLARYKEYEAGCKRAYQALIHLPENTLDTDRQAKLVRPLYMDLLDAADRDYARKRLVEALEHFNWRVGTGFLSTPFLLYVLEDIDLSYAYRLLENEEIPGWLAMPKHGATTIWEDWEGIYAKEVASLDHYSKGAVFEWIFERMCGIKIDGENHFTIAPQPGGSFTHARVKHQSLYGMVASGWEKEDGKYRYQIEIPPNTSATICLPGIKEEYPAGTYTFLQAGEACNVLKGVIR